MLPLSSVWVSSSYNFGELISCLIFRMPPIFVECTPSNGEAFLLAGTTVVGSCSFGGSFLNGKYF